LKEEQAVSLLAAAPLVGYSVRQVNRWWAVYRQGGLARLLEEPPRRGKRTRLTPEAWAGLEAEMVAGRIGTLQDARRYLHEQWGIVYRSLNGVWWQLHRRRAKPKTGRRRHRRANTAEQQAYKRQLRGAAPGAVL
jgi:transposase